MAGVEPIALFKSRYSTLIKAGEPWAGEEQGVLIIALFEKRRTQKKSIALLVSTELSPEMDVERKVTKWSWVSTRPLSFLGCVELNESVISNAVQFDFLLSFLTCFRPMQKNYISRSYKRTSSPTSNISFIKLGNWETGSPTSHHHKLMDWMSKNLYLYLQLHCLWHN